MLRNSLVLAIQCSLGAAAVVFTSSCAQFERSADSGYKPSATELRSLASREGFAFSEITKKSLIKQLENSIASKKELEQYSKALPWFKDDQERMQFLRLEDFEQKQAWLAENKFSERSKLQNQPYQRLISSQDIAIGMPHSFVRQSWGSPQSIEASGNPKLKNEKWLYSKSITGPDGARFERRTVYFEGGRVTGWETE